MRDDGSKYGPAPQTKSLFKHSLFESFKRREKRGPVHTSYLACFQEIRCLHDPPDGGLAATHDIFSLVFKVLRSEGMPLELDGSIRQLILDLLTEQPQRNPYKRFTILSYQLADVGRLLRYMEIYPGERDAYAKYFKTALADLVIQCVVLAQLYNLDFGELLQIGSERLVEFRKKGRYVEVD